MTGGIIAVALISKDLSLAVAVETDSSNRIIDSRQGICYGWFLCVFK